MVARVGGNGKGKLILDNRERRTYPEWMKHGMENSPIADEWRPVCRIAGFAAIAMIVLIPVQIIVFSISLPPETVEDWFALFAKNWLLGLLHLDLVMIVDNVLVALMYLAFFVTLRKGNENRMSVALLLGLLGLAAYFASNTAFEMLSIAGR